MLLAPSKGLFKWINKIIQKSVRAISKILFILESYKFLTWLECISKIACLLVIQIDFRAVWSRYCWSKVYIWYPDQFYNKAKVRKIIIKWKCHKVYFVSITTKSISILIIVQILCHKCITYCSFSLCSMPVVNYSNSLPLCLIQACKNK